VSDLARSLAAKAARDVVWLEASFAQERDVDPVRVDGQLDAARLGSWRPDVRIRMVDLRCDVIVAFAVRPDGSCESAFEPAVLDDADQERLRVQRANIDRLIGPPAYVGSTVAAEILGVHKGNFRRHRHLLTAIPVDGGADVYARADVEALAARWRAER
jgi:hypothetical protein